MWYFIYKVLFIDTIITQNHEKWNTVTGGFCVTTYPLLSNSKLKHILEECPGLRDCRLSEGEFVQYKGRKYAWLSIDQSGIIKMPQTTLSVLDLRPGMELLSIRSSDIAFTMGAKGPLMEKAHRFTGDIERY